jgi:hypothetical protein
MTSGTGEVFLITQDRIFLHRTIILYEKATECPVPPQPGRAECFTHCLPFEIARESISPFPVTRDPRPFPAIRSLSVVPISRDPNPITRWVITPVIIRGRPIIGRWGSIINRRRGEVEQR